MSVVYRSTMEELRGEPAKKVTPKSIEDLRGQNRNNHLREAIYERRDEELRSRESSAHDEAVKHFDARYTDLIGDPALLKQVVIEREKVIADAAIKRHVIDWHKAYPEIGEKVRERVGLPTSREREHYEWIQEARESRGFRNDG